MGKKAVVVLTDGEDESRQSALEVGEVIQYAREIGIPLHMIGFGRADELDEPIMRDTGQGDGRHLSPCGQRTGIVRNFRRPVHSVTRRRHRRGRLTRLAESTGGRYFHARDLGQLKFIYEGLADELQTTYTVTFPSLRQDYDGTSRDINISLWRKGAQVSTVLQEGYNVPGVVVPELEPGVYLVLLTLLGGLLCVPVVLRRSARMRLETKSE